MPVSFNSEFSVNLYSYLILQMASEQRKKNTHDSFTHADNCWHKQENQSSDVQEDDSQ